jgi:hypothetical protein
MSDDEKPPSTKRSGPPAATLGQMIDMAVRAEVERVVAEQKRASAPRLEVPRPRIIEAAPQHPHRDFGVEAMRKQSESQSEMRATHESIMAHIDRSDDRSRDMGIAVAMIGRELGILNKLPSSLQHSIAPPPMPLEVKKPLRVRLRDAVRSLKRRDRPLPELARKQNIVTAVLVIAEFVDKFGPLILRAFSAH